MSKKVFGRQGARLAAIQGLYAWQITGDAISSIEAQLLEKDLKVQQEFSFDKRYLNELLVNIVDQQASLDALIAPFLDRELKDINLIERGILWVALFELTSRQDIPFKVVLNEAINAAKLFGATDSHKFVNGLLDKVVKSLSIEQAC